MRSILRRHYIGLSTCGAIGATVFAASVVVAACANGNASEDRADETSPMTVTASLAAANVPTTASAAIAPGFSGFVGGGEFRCPFDAEVLSTIIDREMELITTNSFECTFLEASDVEPGSDEWLNSLFRVYFARDPDHSIEEWLAAQQANGVPNCITEVIDRSDVVPGGFTQYCPPEPGVPVVDAISWNASDGQGRWTYDVTAAAPLELGDADLHAYTALIFDALR